VHVNWITPTKIRSIRVTGTRGVCFVDYILQTCELFGGSLLRSSFPTITSYESIQEVYRATDRIQFGVQKVEPLRAQAEQFHRYLTGGDVGELCAGRDALAAVLLAERAMQGEAARARPKSIPPADALPTATDEWI
jgi:UDP-N-acetylglucosamine 3-dehydrogenase